MGLYSIHPYSTYFQFSYCLIICIFSVLFIQMDNPRNDVSSHRSSNWKPVSKRQTQRRIKSAVQKFFNTSEMSAGVSGVPQHHHSPQLASMNDGQLKVYMSPNFSSLLFYTERTISYLGYFILFLIKNLTMSVIHFQVIPMLLLHQCTLNVILLFVANIIA